MDGGLQEPTDDRSLPSVRDLVLLHAQVPSHESQACPTGAVKTRDSLEDET